MATTYGPQTEALMQRLRPAGAAPAAPTGTDPFARGGVVKQVPGAGTKGKLADLGASIGTQVAARQLGNSAAQSAAGSVASSGLKSALTSGASGAAAGAGVSLATGLLANKLRDKEDMPVYGGANGQYLDEFGRRMQGTGGGINSNAVKYAGYGANPALAASTMGLSVLGGAAFGAAKGAITKHAKSAFTDFRVEDGAAAIRKAYENELGRPASDEEVQAALVGQGWDPKGGDRWVGEKGINSVIDQIRSSPESQAFKATGSAGQAPSSGAQAPSSDPLGAGGGDPFSTGTQKMRAMLAAPAAGAQAKATSPGQSFASSEGAGGITGQADQAGGLQVEDAAAGGAPNSGQAATATDTSQWDTDGYAPPAYTPPAAGPVPDGWDATKWNDPNHQTPKYGVGRILSNFPPTVEGLTNAFPEIEKAYPGATFNGKDKLTIPGVGTVDVLKGASNGGEAWRWGAEDGAGGAAAHGNPDKNGAVALVDTSGGASNQGDVQALIAQLIGREGQQNAGGLTQALMNQLRATA